MPFFGEIDFAAGTISFDATLQNSRVLTWAISGDGAIRTGWAPQPRSHRFDRRTASELSAARQPSGPAAALDQFRHQQSEGHAERLCGGNAELVAVRRARRSLRQGSEDLARRPGGRRRQRLFRRAHLFQSVRLRRQARRLAVAAGRRRRRRRPRIRPPAARSEHLPDQRQGLGHRLRHRCRLSHRSHLGRRAIAAASDGRRGRGRCATRSPAAQCSNRSSAVRPHESASSLASSDERHGAIDPAAARASCSGRCRSGSPLPRSARRRSPARARSTSRSSPATTAMPLAPAKEDFVRGHFFELSEAERLRSPDFESFKAGFELSAGCARCRCRQGDRGDLRLRGDSARRRGRPDRARASPCPRRLGPGVHRSLGAGQQSPGRPAAREASAPRPAADAIVVSERGFRSLTRRRRMSLSGPARPRDEAIALLAAAGHDVHRNSFISAAPVEQPDRRRLRRGGQSRIADTSPAAQMCR